ncbi:MAG: class I SAM-dependent methyltransferase [Streptococcaceae bacterium]|jgi:ubiquinone/menaquinone biosynthesis C-methylase UbiE|nr:class I SAM-dependent methyltransferase [Streptococcaceae bacterium]
MSRTKHYHDKHEQESSQYYDNIAGNFDHSWDGFLSSFFKRFIVKQLEIPRGAEVLDVGCANGKLLKMLSQAAKRPIRGAGLDISEKMTIVAQALHPEFKFVAGSAQEMPFADQSFDIVICSASFHHFADPAAFLAEAARVLKPNGKLVIAEIRIPVVTHLYNRFITRNSHEGDVQMYRPKELSQLFTENDWAIQRRKIARQIQYYELKHKRL